MSRASDGDGGVPFNGAFSLEDLPVLGEPFAVEFANTLYRLTDTSSIEFLGSTQAVRTWFAYAPAAKDFAQPASLSTAARAELLSLRGATIDLLDSVADGQPVPVDAVATLNEFAGRAPGRFTLTWNNEGPSAALTHIGRPTDIFLARAASEIVSFFAGSDLGDLRRCERPGCFMLFVQHHHKRRYCHEGCSHRTRQARYYRSTTKKPTAMKATTS